jgi:DNA-binding XRE family transcriptional regulator
MDLVEAMPTIEVMPVVVISRTFPARPSYIPEIRDFVRECLAHSPLSPQENRDVDETVSRALLDAAGPTGAIQVTFRIFPDHAEVEVLRPAPDADTGDVGNPWEAASTPPVPVAGRVPAPPATERAPVGFGAAPAAIASGSTPSPSPPGRVPPGANGHVASDPEPETFAEWMAELLRREGLTQQAAARQLGVSVKTIARWVGGETEPRLRDLRRIREMFGPTPFT